MNLHRQALSRPLTKPGLPKIGRNDLCPCRSGLKWKKCHGGPEVHALVNLQKMYRRSANLILGKQDCPKCNGRGEVNSLEMPPEQCRACEGTGRRSPANTEGAR
jgi:DnaJ-class molecular chaperone